MLLKCEYLLVYSLYDCKLNVFMLLTVCQTKQEIYLLTFAGTNN